MAALRYSNAPGARTRTSGRALRRALCGLRGSRGSRALLLAVLVATAFGASACHRKAKHPPRSAGHAQRPPPVSKPTPTPALPDFEVNAVSSSEGNATWYAVPAGSLPQRRAWAGELTAASDQLPPNTYVRVTRLDGKGDSMGIIVRITDDGIHNKGTVIDLSRDAAEALGIVKAGTAPVRVERLALKNATTDKPVDHKDSTPSPKVNEITDHPAASEKQEKAASDGKAGGSTP